MSLDEFTQRPHETENEWKERVKNKSKMDFEIKRRMQEADTSTNLKYDMKILQKQIVDLTNEMKTNHPSKEYTDVAYSYLKEMSPSIYTNIINGSVPDPKEIKCIMYFHNLIVTGKLTKFQASQAYSEYKLKKIINSNDSNNANKTTWDLMRTRNSFADKSIYND